MQCARPRAVGNRGRANRPRQASTTRPMVTKSCARKTKLESAIVPELRGVCERWTLNDELETPARCGATFLGHGCMAAARWLGGTRTAELLCSSDTGLSCSGSTVTGRCAAQLVDSVGVDSPVRIHFSMGDTSAPLWKRQPKKLAARRRPTAKLQAPVARCCGIRSCGARRTRSPKKFRRAACRQGRRWTQ